MEPFFKEIINSYTDSTELKKFASLIGLEDDPYVKEKIFQLECEELFALIDQDEPIPTPEPMEHGDINPPPSATNHETVIQSNGKSSSSLTPGPSKPKYFKPCEKQKIVINEFHFHNLELLG